MKAQVCTNRQQGRYGDQSECRADWCVRMMKRGLMLQRRTTLAQYICAEYAEKHISFQCHMIHLQKQHNYLLSQIGNFYFYFIYLFHPWIIYIMQIRHPYISICHLLCKSRKFLKATQNWGIVLNSR